MAQLEIRIRVTVAEIRSSQPSAADAGHIISDMTAAERRKCQTKNPDGTINFKLSKGRVERHQQEKLVDKVGGYGLRRLLESQGMVYLRTEKVTGGHVLVFGKRPPAKKKATAKKATAKAKA